MSAVPAAVGVQRFIQIAAFAAAGWRQQKLQVRPALKQQLRRQKQEKILQQKRQR